MKRVAEALGVSRSNLAERARGAAAPRSLYRKADDDVLLSMIRSFVEARSTHDYRLITALVNRKRTKYGHTAVNRKRIHRIMQRGSTGRRIGSIYDGKVAVIGPNLRWCSDGPEFACWNGEVIRMAFIIDAFDQEIIALTAVGGSSSNVRDMILEAVEKRFGKMRPPSPIEHLADNGSPYSAEPGAALHAGAQPRVEQHG